MIENVARSTYSKKDPYTSVILTGHRFPKKPTDDLLDEVYAASVALTREMVDLFPNHA